MRKIFLLLVALLIIGIGIYFVFFHFRESPELTKSIRPEVLHVGRFQVTIAWSSEESYNGRVFYQPAGSDSQPLSAAETFPDSYRHEVTLMGLEPSTRYTYWLDGTDSRFQFQTQPAPSLPFSFLLVFGDIADQVMSLMLSEVPEFMVSLTPIPDRGPDPFAEARPYMPVYGPTGVDSPFLRAIEEAESDPTASWFLDWGGLRLVFLRNTSEIAEMLTSPEVHTYGIVASPETVDILDIQQSPLHALLRAHNVQYPAQSAAFIAVIGERDDAVEVDGIHYVGIPAARKTGAIRIDVDVESAYAIFLDEGREITLKQPPLEEKRTCEECRRLADKGAYEESVQAYMSFIEHNQGHYQIEDAYFAIAEILDAKLFRFEEALIWYRRLIAEYPDGTLTPLGKQRIRYLSEYSDDHFEPLARFERIKTVELARKQRPEVREKLLRDAAAIVTEYPNSRIAPVIVSWLANQYSQTNPDQAVELYMQLQANYPDHPDAREVLVEIGELYYNARRYQEALAVYTQTLVKLPELEATIKAQIARCERNLRRRTIALACWGVVGLAGVLAIGLKPFGLRVRKLLWMLVGFIVLGMILAFAAWLIREQFSSSAEMLQLVFLFAIGANISAYLSIHMIDKLFYHKTAKGGNRYHQIAAVTVGSLIGAVIFLASFYLTIYYTYEHYLITAGL